MNIITVPFSDFKEFRSKFRSDTASGKMKSDAFVPNASIFDGVAAISYLFSSKLNN
jgi:hypothetical protein